VIPLSKLVCLFTYIQKIQNLATLLGFLNFVTHYGRVESIILQEIPTAYTIKGRIY